jgi:hypothetical protein
MLNRNRHLISWTWRHLLAETITEVDTEVALAALDVAVVKLTENYETTVQQRTSKGRTLVPIRHDPFIKMLLAAGASSMSDRSSTKSGSGTLINPLALEKIAKLGKDITASWVDLVPGIGPTVKAWSYGPAQSLHLWHETFRVQITTGRAHKWRATHESEKWVGWVSVLELMFNPEPIAENTHPCPECGNRYVIIGEDRQSAITIMVSKLTALCRGCGAEWVGEERLRVLNDLQTAAEVA